MLRSVLAEKLSFNWEYCTKTWTSFFQISLTLYWLFFEICSVTTFFKYPVYSVTKPTVPLNSIPDLDTQFFRNEENYLTTFLRAWSSLLHFDKLLDKNWFSKTAVYLCFDSRIFQTYGNSYIFASRLGFICLEIQQESHLTFNAREVLYWNIDEKRVEKVI